MCVAHNETCQGEAGQVIGETKSYVFQIGIAYVGLIALEFPAKAERMRTDGPAHLITHRAGVADKFAVGKRTVAGAEVVTHSKAANSTLRFRKLEDVYSKVA